MFRSRVGVLVVFVAAGLCLVAAPGASAATGSISGTVTQFGTATPIGGIEVCVESREEGASGDEWFYVCVETGGSGGYSVPNVPDGSYTVEFWPKGQNYIRQFYLDASRYEDAIPVTVAGGQAVSGRDAHLKEGGIISGRVTDALSGDGLQGIEVCAFVPEEYFGGCAGSDANGDYSIPGLAAGSYVVEFWSEDGYQEAVYGGGNGTPVDVTVGATTSGIDAALEKGAGISGRVTDATTGAGVSRTLVCLHEASSGGYLGCTLSGSTGLYSFEGLAGGSYKVGFSEEPEPEFADGYSTQFFDGKATLAEANVITLAAPEVRTGIEGRLTRPGARSPVVAPIVTSPFHATRAPRHRAACKKGFKKKTVKGKTRCVKRKKKHAKKGN